MTWMTNRTGLMSAAPLAALRSVGYGMNCTIMKCAYLNRTFACGKYSCTAYSHGMSKSWWHSFVAWVETYSKIQTKNIVTVELAKKHQLIHRLIPCVIHAFSYIFVMCCSAFSWRSFWWSTNTSMRWPSSFPLWRLTQLLQVRPTVKAKGLRPADKILCYFCIKFPQMSGHFTSTLSSLSHVVFFLLNATPLSSGCACMGQPLPSSDSVLNEKKGWWYVIQYEIR